MSEVIETPDATAVKNSIETVQTAIVEFDKIAAGLAALEAAHPKDIACDVRSSAGMKQAIAGRAAWREPRIAVEKARKAAKAPVLALGREIDAFAKSLEAKLLTGEEHYDEQIKAEEARREQERQRKIEAERHRVAEIQERIDAIKAFPVRAAGKSSIVVEALIGDLVAAEADDTFAEFRPAAERAHAESLAALREMYGAALVHEDDARRLRAEREALEQQRREDEARRAEEDRIAREQHEAEVARVKAAREAEEACIRAEREAEEARMAEARAAQEAELRAQREAEEARAAEQRRIDAERQAAEDARLAAERAEIERQRAEVEAAQRAQEEREAAARAEEQRQVRERDQARYEYECRLEEGAPAMRELLSEALDLVPRISDDDPMAPALADWCHRASATLHEIGEPTTPATA